MSFKRKNAPNSFNVAQKEISNDQYLQDLKELGKIEVDVVVLEKLAALGLNQKAAANFLGMTDRNLRLLFKQRPELEQAFLRGDGATFGRIMAKGVQMALDGDKDMIKFFLKTRAGHTDVQRVEHTGKDGEDIKIVKSSESERNVINKLGPQFSGLLIEDGKVVDE